MAHQLLTNELFKYKDMIKLFKYENYQITISEEALLLKPFSQIWKRDRSKNKEKALSELGYIYFFCDPRSDYQYITSEQQRQKEIIEGQGMDLKWKPDKLVEEAMAFYCKFKSTSAYLLEDTMYAIDKIRTELREMNFKDTDDKGKPIYTLNTLTATIKMIPGLVKELQEAEKAINSEIFESSKMRGQGEKTIFEDNLNA